MQKLIGLAFSLFSRATLSLDSDTETEKLPVSKARRKPEPNKVKDPVDDDKSDEDTESVESFNSSSSAG